MPQTHIGTLPADHLKARRSLVRNWFNVAAYIWSTVGDGKIALALLDRYWSGDDPWVTADYVTAALEGCYSDDTVRRRLSDLAKDKTVLKRREGRLQLFALRPSLAEEITVRMEEANLFADCGENPTAIRNLRSNLVVVGPYRNR